MFTAQALKSLNKLEMLVYQYVMEHRFAVPYMRIRELATEAHVSTTTVLHFCKKMGCEGFSQFKWKLKEEGGTNARDKDIPDSLSEPQTFFWLVGTPVYQEKLENAAAIIARMERIFMVGIGNSGGIASYGARYFYNLGKFALCVSDPFYPSTLAQFCDLTLPYYTTMRRSEAENYDYSSQIQVAYLLEFLARRVHDRLNE